MATTLRVSPEEVYSRVKSGESLLVCAYPNEDTFKTMRLEGAISLQEFQSRAEQLPRDREIIFYCA
ncbi:MAG: hypothetical protein WAU47_13155 [Desulfobaccales bacterium]